MISSPALAWTLTVAFAGTAGYCLLRCLAPAAAGAPRGAVPRIADCWHALMSVGMVAMLWPWGMRIPAPLQYAVFGAGALFFAAQLVRPPAGHGRGALAHHAAMMLAMVWMVAAMPFSMNAGSVGTTPMPGMPWMAAAGTGGGGALPAGVLLTGVAAALCLAAGAVYWTARSIDRVRAAIVPADWRPVLATGCHAVMSLGMAASLAVLL